MDVNDPFPSGERAMDRAFFYFPYFVAGLVLRHEGYVSALRRVLGSRLVKAWAWTLLASCVWLAAYTNDEMDYGARCGYFRMWEKFKMQQCASGATALRNGFGLRFGFLLDAVCPDVAARIKFFVALLIQGAVEP